MHVKGKVCVVTGAASGIGEAVARAYAEAGARGVVVADLKTSRDRLAKVAGDIDGLAVTGDVGLEEDIKALIAAAEDKYGPVDVFFSNAGLSRKGQESASDADWDVSWRVHVMSHVFAARALVPGMLARGSGYLLNTASAAGLLASLNSMPYGVTKNAAVALAEHLAIQYGDRGIRVSVLCPQSVQTGMTTPGPSAARVDGVLQPPEVARMVIEAMEAERFLILSHPQVAEYMQRKASSRDRWLDRHAAAARQDLRRAAVSLMILGANGCQHPGVVLRARRRVGAAPRGRELQADQRLGLLHRGRHAVDDGNAEFLRQLLREIGHARRSPARSPPRPCRARGQSRLRVSPPRPSPAFRDRAPRRCRR